MKLNKELPDCVIFDIDGTLAKMHNRSPYDWKKVGEDKVNVAVKHILDGIVSLGKSKIFLFSGRDEVCRNETVKWLDKHNIKYDELHMRPKKNQEKDTVIKKRMYEELISGKYNCLFVVDDRPIVCRMWRDMDLEVLQVGNPYKEF